MDTLTLKILKKKKYDKLDSVIRVVSPKVPIERFLTNQNPEKNIDELLTLSYPNKSEKKNIYFSRGYNYLYLF